MTDDLARLVDRACPNPVFVIGSPRSGTSVVPWALAQHPRFWTSPESAFLQELFPRGAVEQSFATAEAVGWADALRVDRSSFAAHIGLGLNVLLTSRSGGRRWIDQTPANTNVLPELAQLFPGATFLHMVRDGRDVVHSMQHFSRRLGANLAAEGSLPAWAGEFRASVRTWCEFVSMAMAFESQHPHRCIRLRLEDAVSNPDQVFQELLGQLGEAPDPRPAAYFTSQRINSSFGDERGNAAPAGPSMAADPASCWTAEEQRIFVEEGGEALLEVLGYPPSTRGGRGSSTVATSDSP